MLPDQSLDFAVLLYQRANLTELLRVEGMRQRLRELTLDLTEAFSCRGRGPTSSPLPAEPLTAPAATSSNNEPGHVPELNS